MSAPAEYAGATRCAWCRCEIRPAQPGHEGDPVSDGIGRCCWDVYRAEMGLPVRPYPGDC